MSNNIKAQYPTWGDLAREQLRRRGVPYFKDVQHEIRTRLSRLLPTALKVFALACAERLMKQHEELPSVQQQSFTLQWRPVLNAMWAAVGSESQEAIRVVRNAVDAFGEGPYDHDEGQEGPSEADENTAAASIAAAKCFVGPDPELACLVSSRAIDAAFRIAEDDLQLDPNEFVWDPAGEPMPLAKEAMHPSVQNELSRQLSDLSTLEGSDITAILIEKLRG